MTQSKLVHSITVILSLDIQFTRFDILTNIDSSLCTRSTAVSWYLCL